MGEKKGYESPKAEKLEFDFTSSITASGASSGGGNFETYDEEDGGSTYGTVYRQSASYCTIYHDDDGCMGC